ncbi:MAG: radical SAM protein [Deltaproteobacteria bacterium]|nr:radical SAM protein [Deltaproteobacteria bacterium]
MKRKEMLSFKIEKIYLDVKAETNWVTRHILKSLPDVPVERVEDKKNLIKQFLPITDPIGMGKRNLLITHFYGRRLKPCPGTSRHICCGYYVINPITNCPMDCSYCVLQGYLNNPFLTLYSNWDDLLQEVESFLAIGRPPLSRLGTGELSDSLALESIFPISQFLVPFFAKKNAILELKTKSTEVEHLLSLDHRGRTVVSWSLNPPQVIEEEERGTASLEERIDAAKRCQEAGYPLGFHFDPMIDHEGWEKGYEGLINFLFSRIDPKRVVWISLGGFRYPAQLKGIAEERFPKTRIFLGELFPGGDGKFRYFKTIRVEMYRKMVKWLKQVSPDLFIYLCMESQEVWKEVFGWSPQNSQQLNQLFEERVKKFIKIPVEYRPALLGG